MFHEYPYTDFHELNLDYLMKLARESLGLHLDIQGKDLALVNAAGQNVSKVRVAFATTAEKDEEGNDIVAYVFDAGLEGRALVFTKGDGSSESIVIPFATTAEKDVNNKDITSYVSRVGVSGNKILVTFGDGTTYSFTCPYANKAGQAETDENGKNLTTYVADVEVSGNNLVFKDGEGVTLRTITVSYATEAGTAEKAAKDLQGNAFLSTYGYQLSIDGNKIGIDSHDGTTINKITVPFSTVSTDATNAIETVTINGNDIIFTTFGGTQFTVTCPFAVKAQKDDLGNNIKNTYVANVTTNPNTGAITFLDAQGNTIVTITPTVDAATHDALGNTISDYVKAIAVSASSNYVTVTHGDGDVDTLTINYSTHAFKDLNNQSIHNTYCTLLACEEDVEDGHYKLVGYNGDVPVAEIFRITLIADAAKHDHLGNVIADYYGHSLAISDNDLSLKNANGTVLSTVELPTPSHYAIIFTSDATSVEAISTSNLVFSQVTRDNIYIVDPSTVNFAEEYLKGSTFTVVVLCNNFPGQNTVNISFDTTPGNGNGVIKSFTETTDFYVVHASWDVVGNTITMNTWETERIEDTAGATDLSDLDDVQISNIWQGSILQWVGGSAGHWENMQFQTIGPKKVLAYNGPSDNPASTWQPKNIDTSYLSDVNVSSPSDGEVLKYDATSQKWVNGSAGGGGGSSALVVTLTGAYAGTTIDIGNMAPNSSVTVNADSTYAAIKAADDIIFKIVDTTPAGSKYTLRPTGMHTLNVSADQALFFTFSVLTPNMNVPKVFRLEVGPWSNAYTLVCVSS